MKAKSLILFFCICIFPAVINAQTDDQEMNNLIGKLDSYLHIIKKCFGSLNAEYDVCLQPDNVDVKLYVESGPERSLISAYWNTWEGPKMLSFGKKGSGTLFSIILYVEPGVAAKDGTQYTPQELKNLIFMATREFIYMDLDHILKSAECID